MELEWIGAIADGGEETVELRNARTVEGNKRKRKIKLTWLKSSGRQVFAYSMISCLSALVSVDRCCTYRWPN